MMKFKKINIILFLLVAVSSNVWSQDCAAIRAQAADLESALSESNPKSYYDYAAFLGTQDASDNGCLNEKILNSIGSILYDGYALDDLRCGVRLAMIYEYGLYEFPTNRGKAHDYANGILHVAGEAYESDQALYKEFGWVAPTLYLKNFNAQKADAEELARVESAYQLLKEIQPDPISDNDWGSFVRAKSDYHQLRIDALLAGNFGQIKNVEEGIQYAYSQSEEKGNNTLKYYLIDNPNASFFDNSAALLFFATQESKDHASDGDAILFSSNLYQKHIGNIRNFAGFERSYALASDEFKRILDDNFPGYSTEKQKWDFVNASKLKDPDGHKGWKFLPEDEQRALFREANWEESDLSNKEKFQIFKAMSDYGDNAAILPLAMAYANGEGVVRNPQKAISLLEDASRMSDLKEHASFELALIYDKGLGVKRDWAKAASYYKNAVEEYEEANETLGEFYTFGVGGLPKDLVKAKQYFKIAAEYGSSTAETKLELLELLNDFQKEAAYNDWELKVENSSQFGTRVIPYGGKLDVTVSYNVKENSENNFVQIFPNGSQSFAIQYGSYSPCGALRGIGKHDVYVYHRSSNERRQFGLFYVVAKDKYGSNIALAIPMAVCFLPE